MGIAVEGTSRYKRPKLWMYWMAHYVGVCAGEGVELQVVSGRWFLVCVMKD